MLIPSITTAAQVSDQKKQIAENKQTAAQQGLTPALLKLSSINIAFSHRGLVNVSLVR